MRVKCLYICIFFFKQKTAYEMRISDWSSDVCSSDLMSIRRASVSGRWPAWVGLGFASIAGVAMAAGPVEPDANTPADAAASVPATELDRVVVTATRQADDALLVPAAVDVVGTEDLRRARPQL